MATDAFRTSNPTLRDDVFRQVGYVSDRSTSMTVQGTAVKTLGLVGILLLAACFTWSQTLIGAPAFTSASESFGPPPDFSKALPYVLVGAIGGLILALVTMFVPRVSPWTAPLYAALEGLFLGGISAIFEYRYPGLVFQAVGLTVATLVSLLMMYSSGIIRVSERFKAGVLAATGAVCLVYLVSMVLRLFGVSVPYIHAAGPIGIGFSAVVVVIAALNLVLDFDLISENASRGAPKYMEWYCGFSLIVTLVWLYLEILRLLAKLREFRD